MVLITLGTDWILLASTGWTGPLQLLGSLPSLGVSASRVLQAVLCGTLPGLFHVYALVEKAPAFPSIWPLTS